MGSKKPFPETISTFMDKIEGAVKSGSTDQLSNFIQDSLPDHESNFPTEKLEQFAVNPHIKLWAAATHKSSEQRWETLLEHAKKACLEDDLYTINMDYFD